MLKTDSPNIKYFTAQQTLWCCQKNMISKKLNISCSVTVSRLEFVFVPIADQLQPKFLETAMCGTQDYKNRLKKYHAQCR